MVETVRSAAAVEQARAPTAPVAVVVALVVALVAAAVLLVAGRPQPALAASVAVLALGVLAARADIALLVLVALAPLESSIRLGDSQFLSATKLAGAAVFGSFALLAFTTRRRILVDGSHVVLLVLLAVAMVSSVFARSFEAAAETTLRYGSFVGLYFVITQFVGNHKLFYRLTSILLGASTAAAILAMWNFFVSGFPLARPRYGDANDLAFVLATTVPVGIWLAIHAPRHRRLAVVATGIVVVGLMLTFSRGALLGLGAGLIWHAVTDRRQARVLLGSGLVAAVLAVALVQMNAAAIATGLGAKANISEYNVESRFTAWAAALDLAGAHPIVGIGPGNFGLYYHEITDSPPGTFALEVAHNAYVDLVTELGLSGLGLFVAYLVMVLARSSVAVAGSRGPPGLAAAARTALVVAVVGLLTHSQQYFMPVWFFGAIATAIWKEAPSGSST